MLGLSFSCKGTSVAIGADAIARTAVEEPWAIPLRKSIAAAGKVEQVVKKDRAAVSYDGAKALSGVKLVVARKVRW